MYQVPSLQALGQLWCWQLAYSVGKLEQCYSLWPQGSEMVMRFPPWGVVSDEDGAMMTQSSSLWAN